MKKIQYILFITTLFLFGNIAVNAGICDDDYLESYKQHANNLKITYELDEEYVDSNGVHQNGIYKISVTGLEKYTSIRIKELDKKVSYSKENQGNVTLTGIESGIKKVSIYFDNCDILLRLVTLNIPIYNKYADREECKGITDLDVCDETYEYELNESTFQYKLKKYNEKKQEELEEEEKNKESKVSIVFNNIVEFLKDYYLYIVISIVVIVAVTGYFVLRKRRYTLE